MTMYHVLLAGVALVAAPALAQTAPAPAATPAAQSAPAAGGTAAASATPNVAAGAAVSDAQGAAVGTIESVANGIATLSTGTTKAGIPVGSFAQGPNGLVIGLTKAQIDAQASAAQSAQAAAPAAAPKFEVGAKVSDASGAQVGTVKAVAADTVTVASATASAQLPKASFAQGADGLVIGLSPAQFEAAAKAAGGAKG